MLLEHQISIYCAHLHLTVDHQLLDRQAAGSEAGQTHTISSGAPQGCVLSPLLFSLYTNDCTSKDPSVKLLKFTDDTTGIGLIKDGDKSAYRQEVEQLAVWCSLNNLRLNTLKTVEMIVHFRRTKPWRVRGLGRPWRVGDLGCPWWIRGLRRPWRSGEHGRPWRVVPPKNFLGDFPHPRGALWGAGRNRQGLWRAGRNRQGLWRAGRNRQELWRAGQSRQGLWRAGHNQQGLWRAGRSQQGLWRAGRSQRGLWRAGRDQQGLWRAGRSRHWRALGKRRLSAVLGRHGVSGVLWQRNLSGALWQRNLSGALWQRNLSGALWQRSVSGALWQRSVSGVLWQRGAGRDQRERRRAGRNQRERQRAGRDQRRSRRELARSGHRRALSWSWHRRALSWSWHRRALSRSRHTRALSRSRHLGWAPPHPLICHQQAQRYMNLCRWAYGGWRAYVCREWSRAWGGCEWRWISRKQRAGRAADGGGDSPRTANKDEARAAEVLHLRNGGSVCLVGCSVTLTQESGSQARGDTEFTKREALIIQHGTQET